MKKRRIAEPTLHDVIDIMDTRFTTSDKRFEALTLHMTGMQTHLNTIEREMDKMNTIQLDMQEDLTATLDAFDRDSRTILDHERRIKRLEKARR